MKHTFLLDENVFIRGLFEESTARDLWRTIAAVCCHKVATSYELYENYWRHLRTMRRHVAPESASALVRIVNLILHDQDKSMWVNPEGPTPLADLVRHLNDRYLADIASEVVASGETDDCVFVSTDVQTREDFNHRQMHEIGISGTTIETGLELAGDKDC